MSIAARGRTWGWLAAALVSAACSEPISSQLHHLTESRRLAADLSVHVARAGEASNRAVMAGTDESAAAFADEARASLAAVAGGTTELRSALEALRFSAETRLLDEFVAAFNQFREQDEAILLLAVQNTNLKAQRLSFGAAADAADAFVAGLEGVEPASRPDEWKLRALVAEAAAGLRELQVLEAPHIAEASAEHMTRLETRMAAAERSTRASVDAIAGIAAPASRQKLAEARAAFTRFLEVHRELLRLSRENSNVRSLALALGQFRNVRASCEAAVQALRKSLDEQRLGPSR